MSGVLISISSPLICQLKALESMVEGVPVLDNVLQEVDNLKSPNNNGQVAALPDGLWNYVQFYDGVSEEIIEFNGAALSDALYDSAKVHIGPHINQLDDCLLNNPFQVFQSLFKTIDYFLGSKANDRLDIPKVDEALDYLVNLTKTFVLNSSNLLEDWLKAKLDQAGLEYNKVPVELDKYKKFILEECLDESKVPYLAARSDLIKSMHLSA